MGRRRVRPAVQDPVRRDQGPGIQAPPDEPSMPVVVAGSASPGFASALADALGCDVLEAERKDFPDGEVYVRIPDEVQGRHAVVVQSTTPNDNLLELLFLQDACHEAGARKVTTVVPYFAYARQDQCFRPGEGVSARAVARAIYPTANHLILVDPHKKHLLDFFPGVANAVTAVPQLCERLQQWGVEAVLAPDAGARDRAELAAEVLGVECDHLEKTRHSATEVTIQTKDLDVSGKTVAILDDMIASGGTMLEAAKQLKAQGATQVIAACTHGVFTQGAVERLLGGGIDKLLCTDTLEGADCDTVSAAPAVAQELLALEPAA